MSADRTSTPGHDGAVPPGARPGVVADLFLDDRARLDERTRIGARALLETSVAALESDLAAQLRRILPGAPLGNAPVYPRLAEAGLLHDPHLVAEMIAQARIAAIDEALLAQRMPGSAPGLLVRLAESRDRDVRAAALAFLLADNRAKQPAGDLPLSLHRRLVWWVAAAMRERIGPDADAALAEAAERSIAARHDTPDVGAAAATLAAAIDARAEERGHLLLDTLLEGRTTLFAAALAQALGIDPVEARAAALDAAGDGLWFALRALDLPRATIARIGWIVSEADAARDVEALPGLIDRIAAVTPEEAARHFATLALPAPFRAAVRALGAAA